MEITVSDSKRYALILMTFAGFLMTVMTHVAVAVAFLMTGSHDWAAWTIIGPILLCVGLWLLYRNLVPPEEVDG